MQKKVTYEVSMEEVLEKFGVDTLEITSLGVDLEADISSNKLIISYVTNVGK